MPPDDCILFEHFVKLLHSISQLKPRRANSRLSTNDAPKSLQLVVSWLAQLRKYHSSRPQTCQIFFRLLFPEEDVRRRYNLKETTLARSLAKDVFGVSTGMDGAGRILLQWSDQSEINNKPKLGCLGVEVEKVLSDRFSFRHAQSLDIRKIDYLLDELASLSGYSNLGTVVARPKRRRAAILKDLFLGLDPIEAKFLTQIILKDLRPVLYPLTETHTTRALLDYRSNAVHILTKWEVMKAWNPCMPRVYRSRATLDEAASAVETLPVTGHPLPDHEAFSPVLGVPIEIQKSQKGIKLSHALSYFRNQNHDVWAETKYDGERMQIHIDLTRPPSHQIKIFSKSKRDSTLDRIGTHPIIRAALNLPSLPEDFSLYPALERHGKGGSALCELTSIVLDAEMVCYSESREEIDEFWRLRSLIDRTAHGMRGPRRHEVKSAYDSQERSESSLSASPDVIVESLQSNASDNGDRHLKLIFFDVLLLNGSSLLSEDYITRRAQLERLINQIPGFVSLSLRQRICLSDGFPAAIKMLAKVFSEHIASHQEGLVLKASKSLYNDSRLPWVKLKRDYIPGYGDTVDLVIIGAGWSKDRARELRVSPQTFTTFFVAAPQKPIPVTDLSHCTAQFQVLFSVEYGMSREQLEAFNMYLKTSETHPHGDNMPALPYTFKLPQRSAKPAVMLMKPVLVELFGAGFTKDAATMYYTLRFPRIAKVWSTNERSWAEGVHLDEFQRIARLSIGRESSEEWANRTVRAMWGCDVDPGPKDPRKIAETSGEWYQKLLKLEMLDGSSDTRNSSRRKALSTGMPCPPRKRQKLQTGRDPDQSLRAMWSMTNLVCVGADAEQKGQSDPALHKPIGLVPLQNGHTQHTVRETEGATIQVDPVFTTPESTDRTQAKFDVTPLYAPPSGHSSPFALQVSTFMDVSQNVEALPFAQPAPSGIPRAPATSQQALASNAGDPVVDETSTQTLRDYWPQKFVHTPVVQFLRDAYVWIPQNPDNKRPLNRPPAFELVPQNRRIGVISFLLIICGCRVDDIRATAEKFAHVNKCVIFVNTRYDSEREGLTWLFRNLETWRQELNRPGNKELFVFDSSMITFDSLAAFNGEVAPQALWRSSRKFDPMIP